MRDYSAAVFIKSVAQLMQLPLDDGAEVAFAGRSNAGKSSALNAITGRRALARTSRTPGRTQLLNFFGLPCGSRLVDLPGYGYAEVPLAVRQEWAALVEGYLGVRRSLKGLMLVMDIRHPLTPFDQQMMRWCATAGVACHVLLTKADKLGRGAAGNALLMVRRSLEQEGTGATVQLFSAVARQGVDEARERLECWLGDRKAE
ncbi:MAG: ribosome biogenesis GTP-binding protein YihA/YsxC [Pseudomonadota bacterium]